MIGRLLTAVFLLGLIALGAAGYWLGDWRDWRDDTPKRPKPPKLVLERVTTAESGAITACLTRGWNGLALRWNKSADPLRYENAARHVYVNVEDWKSERRVRVYARKDAGLTPGEIRWMDSCTAPPPRT